ncbi:Outer membrane protein alpha precursor [Sporomusa ovata DSM 2662]|uniref:S-layer domain protein domain protein n=1 Tax=Sporomusa ovata TaxID=2378 RepID=A0A0U1KUI9_9FIRM|nr:S-layer homology domain-containing protein [Sporomusa ovata]EQB26479.1 S-layer domain-containing protein [Sporomusa ovata DSM 2662]CQR70563.1 S-layer domain protein domain protein [Sporomusa ovata]
MKRQTAMALAAVFAMSVAGTALAAPANPFVDVPAKHWAYDAINKLAQAGVISGYGDGTYQGNKTLTRYEVATIVAKAMANSDKADAATKREIEALKAEFGTELNNLGVRVDNLEKNSSKVKFTGEIRERYEWNDEVAKDGDRTGERTRVRISMTAPIDENVTFKGRFHSESEWGAGTGSEAKIDQAYITGAINGLGYSFGRQPLVLGQKLLANNSQYNDGLLLSAGNNIKVTGFAFKKEDKYDGTAKNLNFAAGNIDFKVNQNLNITASYLADQDEIYYKSVAAGLKYTGWKDFTVTGEYGENDSYTANNSAHNGDTAKAWASRIKYKGAVASKAHSYGLYVSYRKAESGFDPVNWNDFTDSANWKGIKEMDDIKGVDYGFEYALFKNGIMRIQYNDMEDEKTGKVNKDNMFAELIYTF